MHAVPGTAEIVKCQSIYLYYDRTGAELTMDQHALVMTQCSWPIDACYVSAAYEWHRNNLIKWCAQCLQAGSLATTVGSDWQFDNDISNSTTRPHSWHCLNFSFTVSDPEPVNVRAVVVRCRDELNSILLIGALSLKLPFWYSFFCFSLETHCGPSSHMHMCYKICTPLGYGVLLAKNNV